VDKQVFFNLVRQSVFGGHLNTSQVSGMERIISEADRRGINNEWLAYIMASVAWEGAYTFQPITERGARSYFNKYEPNTPIGKRLGNKKPGDGYKYRGMGDIMMTGLDNFTNMSEITGIDLVNHPEMALDPRVSTQILFEGMLRGTFTGKSLDDYLDGIDESDVEDKREAINARRIVNSTDKAEAIAELFLKFEHALRASGRSETGSPTQPPLPIEIPTPPSGSITVSMTPRQKELWEVVLKLSKELQSA
jgi:putative chitinase